MLFMTIVLASHHVSISRADAVASGGLLITEFYPCALSGDEYIVVSNSGSETANLLNWSLTDGEGVLTFRKDAWLGPSRSLAISFNSTSYWTAFGHGPDFCIDDPTGNIARTGTLRLADDGDSLALVSPTGAQADFVRYGTASETSPLWVGDPVPSIRQGEVCKRIKTPTGWSDTNLATDWEPFREYRYGYTELAPLEIEVPTGGLVAFTSPDCALDVVLESIGRAQEIIRLCSYELSSAAVCTELLRAYQKGVSVRMLVDGAPAGGMSEPEKACLSSLADAGAEVNVLNGNLSEKVVQHIGPLHCKYLVIDTSISLVLSENFVESGLPKDKIIGNRGWGIWISSESVARYLGSMFDSDSRPSRPDVKRWIDEEDYASSSAMPEPSSSNHSYGALLPLRSSSSAMVRLLPSPDASELRPFLVPPMCEARSLLVEQFQVELSWQGRWQRGPATSPLIGSLIEAMRGGSSVRMLFDSSWYNADVNGPVCRFLSSACANESLRGEFRMMDPRNPIQVVHNKGVVLDGRTTLVSSNNWGHSSFAKNRELAVLIDSEEIAGYFTKAFDMDWTADETPPTADAGPDQTVQIGTNLELNASHSWDDRAIAHYGWDLDDDGFMESDGPSAVFAPDRLGRFVIRLSVEDAWGNGDTDSATVTVVDDASAASGNAPSWGLSRLAAVLSLACGALVGRRLALRRLRGSGKINQRPGA